MADSISQILLNDIDLLDEIDDILRHQLMELEQSGSARGELEQAAERLGKIYDLVDACMFESAHKVSSDESFKEQTYHYLVERFMERIQAVYDMDNPMPPEQTKLIVERTRSKLRRLRRLLLTN